MGIFDRIATVIKSNINDLIDKAENPEKMVKQLLADMEDDLLEVKKQVALSIATEKQLYRQYIENQKKADEWMKKAELAVSSGQDDLAREALSRKTSYQNTADGFKVQWEAQKNNVEALKTNLRKLESKINEARIKKDLLIARSRQAKAQQLVNKTMGRIGSSSTLSAFDRMEEKVNQREAIAAAYGELDGESSLEERFAALEAGSSVDDELAALKAKLGK